MGEEHWQEAGEGASGKAATWEDLASGFPGEMSRLITPPRHAWEARPALHRLEQDTQTEADMERSCLEDGAGGGSSVKPASKQRRGPQTSAMTQPWALGREPRKQRLALADKKSSQGAPG